MCRAHKTLDGSGLKVPYTQNVSISKHEMEIVATLLMIRLLRDTLKVHVMDPFADEYQEPNKSTSSNTPNIFYQSLQSQLDISLSIESDSIGGNFSALLKSEQNQSAVVNPIKPKKHDEERCQACQFEICIHTSKKIKSHFNKKFKRRESLPAY